MTRCIQRVPDDEQLGDVAVIDGADSAFKVDITDGTVGDVL
ncbi:hypothetical protein [Mycobacterium paragordonae]|uniref:Uncharacterized protein n=1 Tax=Mycobacterium paragordonae TaxID=1389713 RepID=A0AAJ1W3V0_9MYCO|nr:hypothetical protein [Mycobacterium paragordonae]MDP7738710.1 hypothetical protein [Mycobacterium paragordonae]